MASQLYAIPQYGTPNAYRRLMAEQERDDNERRYQEGMDEQRKANAWEEEEQPDYLQAALGGLMTVGGAVIPGAQPLAGAGLGMIGSGLTKKGMRNYRTGQRASGATDMTGAQLGAQLGKDSDLESVLKKLFAHGDNTSSQYENWRESGDTRF